MKHRNWKRIFGISLYEWVCQNQWPNSSIRKVTNHLSSMTGVNRSYMYNLVRRARLGQEKRPLYKNPVQVDKPERKVRTHYERVALEDGEILLAHILSHSQDYRDGQCTSHIKITRTINQLWYGEDVRSKHTISTVLNHHAYKPRYERIHQQYLGPREKMAA